jgi:hypothetical protein
MPAGAFALLERSLRIDARAWSTHLSRLGLLGAIYLSLCFALWTQQMFGAPGLRFFQGIAYLDIAFMTLLGLGFFATSITEEKEEDTLGLMLMAGISPLGILAGKSGGRLWQALLLIVAQFPFTLLAVTMGGIASRQIWSMTIALIAYMVFLAGFGLFCSTISANSRRASGLMFAGLVAYLLVPLAARGMSWNLAQQSIARGSQFQPDMWRQLLDGIGETCIFLRMGEILTTGFRESLASLQVVSNVAAGIIGAGLSWLLFGVATRSPATEASTRGLVGRRPGFLRFDAGRPWGNPLIWKDFYFVSGGFGMVFVRVLYYVGLGVVALGFENFYSRGKDSWLAIYLLLLSFSVPIEAALVLARSMQDEVRGQMLPSLLMLPRTSTRMVYSKFAGTLLGWLPGPIIGLIVTMNTEYGRQSLSSLLNNDGGGWVILLLFVLIPHFAALVSLYVRWGAVPLAIGMTIGVYILIVMAMITVRVGGNPSEFLAIIAFLMVGLCGVCHLAILLRFQALSTR